MINSDRLLIRDINMQDAEKMIQLRKMLAIETKFMMRELDEVNTDIEKERERIAELQKDKNSKVVVAEYEGNIIGYIGVGRKGYERVKHVASFAVGVEKKYWGTGVSRELMKSMLKWAEENNIKRIELDVVHGNKRGLNLYKSYGFEVEGIKRKDHYIGDGQYLDTVIMSKLL